MRHIIGIDPGNEQSAFVELNDTTVVDMGILDNHAMLHRLERPSQTRGLELAIEMVAPMGMPIGRTTMHTLMWIGRYTQHWEELTGRTPTLIERHAVKRHICNHTAAKDSNIIASLADRYGGSPQAAKGTKAAPGPLYGIKADIWQALAVAITHLERAEAWRIFANAVNHGGTK
jgi:hypothetical protein